MADIVSVKGEILDTAIAEVQHAFMIWDEPPVEAIAKAILNVTARVLSENSQIIAPDTTGADSYRIVCNLLKN